MWNIWDKWACSPACSQQKHTPSSYNQTNEMTFKVSHWPPGWDHSFHTDLLAKPCLCSGWQEMALFGFYWATHAKEKRVPRVILTRTQQRAVFTEPKPSPQPTCSSSWVYMKSLCGSYWREAWYAIDTKSQSSLVKMWPSLGSVSRSESYSRGSTGCWEGIRDWASPFHLCHRQFWKR